MRNLRLSLLALGLVALGAPQAHAGYQRTFPAGSLIVPMDLSYQDTGMLQAYGLVFQLLRQGVTVYWVIDPQKTWHHADCDTPGDECPWDCEEQGSGVKCPYPTASPDFYASAEVVWDDSGVLNAGDPIANHGYRGGPFVIAAADAAAALPIIEAWNDQSLWGANPWATRSVFEVVSVQRATAPFDGYVRKEMLAAPTIAVFSDGNEDIATGYLRAAGIPQSSGDEFPAAKCAAGGCGPGTANPDMLTVESIMGDMGTCSAPNQDHKNGALFTPDGVPAYCQIMSMHWAVNDRETVECDGGACPATQAECAGETFTYHGHEVVAEVRQFLLYPTHFYAECQAVNAYENTSPNPAWPYLDDADRNGHFLTTTGNPPDCPCTDGDFECVTGGCDNGARDCCLSQDAKEIGAGFLIAAQPASATLQVFHPDVPYNQLDGAFATVGGSEPAYNLSAYLGTTYQNNMDVTFITGPNGPGEQDVWMTGYMDGQCEIGVEVFQPGQCTKGKVSYLGGHEYRTDVPLSANPDAQGTRLFLNALFEADCVTSEGQPDPRLTWSGDTTPTGLAAPLDETYTVNFSNVGRGSALDTVLRVTLPAGMTVVDQEPGATVAGQEVTWDLGTLGAAGGQPGDPASNGSRWLTVRLPAFDLYTLEAILEYRVGVSEVQTAPALLTIQGWLDTDGDTVPDASDLDPTDPMACGDSDNDSCDDCAVAGVADPFNDGPDADHDGICDAGDHDDGGVNPNGDGGSNNNGNGNAGDGCGCQTPAAPGDALGLLLLGLLFLGLQRGRRIRRRRARRP